ncbi:acyl carrier protein [Candidatus Marinimicrobia bacterium]|nr:acyl carrier protein [Candidatus Neomarinimicrobiota bacterium]
MNLIEFIAEVFSVEKNILKLDTMPGDFPEWDSLGHLNLLTSLEEKFNISFDMEETMSIQSINDLKDILSKKGIDCS